VAIALGLLLPTFGRSVVAVGQAVPKDLPYAAAWSQRFTSQTPPALAIGPASVVLAFARDPLQVRAPGTGEIMWSAPLASAVPPAVGDGLVFAISEGRLHALDELTGQRRWDVELDGPSAGPTWRPDWVIVAVGTEIRAYRSRDGHLGWHTDVGAIATHPALVDGNLVLVTLDAPGVVALDGAGAVQWKMALDAAPGPLAVAGGRVYFGAADHSLRAYLEATGTFEWAFDRMELVGRPVVTRRQVFAVLYSNEIRGVDPRIGNLRQMERLDARPAPGLTAAGSDLLVPLNNGDFLVMESGNLKKKTRISSPVPRDTFEIAAIAADGSRVYSVSVAVSGDRTLTAFEHRPRASAR